MHLDRDSALTAAEPLPSPAATLLELDVEPARPSTSLTRDSILFGLGTLAGKGIGFLILPILARLMTPDDFGRLDVLNALVSSGILILMLGTDVAAVRLYFDRPDALEKRRLFATWYALGILATAVPSVVLVVWAAPISRFLLGSEQLASAVALVGITLIAGIVHFITLGVLRATGRPLAYAVLEGGALLVNAALAVLLVAGWRPDATAVLLALAVSWSVAALVGVIGVWGAIVARPSVLAARAILRLAPPLAPAIGAAWGADFLHRAFLLGAAGATEAAFLSVATRIASVAMLVVAAAQLAWHPRAYRVGVLGEARNRLAVEGRQIVVALVVCVGLLGVFTPEVLALIGGDSYRGAAPAVGLSLISVLGVGLFTVGSLPSAIARRTGDLAVAVVAGVGVAVAINLLVARSLGASGTAAAIATGQFVSAAVVAWLGRRHETIPFAWSRIVLLIALAIGVVLGSTYAAGSPVVPRVVLGAALAAALLIEGTLRTSLGDMLRRRRQVHPADEVYEERDG